jgi:hypothetical protein
MKDNNSHIDREVVQGRGNQQQKVRNCDKWRLQERMNESERQWQEEERGQSCK